MGGFIAAKQPLIDAYLMSARQRLFSIALTIPVRPLAFDYHLSAHCKWPLKLRTCIQQDTAALLEAVTMLGESEDKVEKLWANVEYLNNGFKQLGFDIGHSETPIIPVRVRSRRSRNPLAGNVLCESTKMSVAGNAGRRGAREGIQR